MEQPIDMPDGWLHTLAEAVYWRCAFGEARREHPEADDHLERICKRLDLSLTREEAIFVINAVSELVRAYDGNTRV